MKRGIFTIITTIAIMILIGSSYASANPSVTQKKYAAKNCTGSQAEMENCMDKKIEEADKAVESAYFDATMVASEETKEKENLIENQRIWKVNRALGMEIMKARYGEMRGYGRLEIKNYYLKLTNNRTKELKFMYSSPEDPPVDF